MSCIAGIINLDGAPVDRALLEGMVGAMQRRAPDASSVWCSGAAGLGHALLRIAPESANEHQPCTLDGQAWITADARIDGRDELIGRLRAAGRQVPDAAPDPELILHAYGAFGSAFLQYLIGDFALALWDGRTRELICARDHFGIRPFFHARTAGSLIFASDIDAILAHPEIARGIDEAFIADFLLFSVCMDSERTAYRDIRRLPAAHRICADRRGVRVRRYWDLPPQDAARHERADGIVDQFGELFRHAVGDRMRESGVALELSGGMDSSSIAATAAALAGQSGTALKAYTIDCGGLIPADDEGRLAAAVAAHLNVPISRQRIEDYALFQDFGTPRLRTAEPFGNPDLAMHCEKLRWIEGDGTRILLSGLGGDSLFSGSSTHFADLLRAGRLARFVAEATRHRRRTGSLAGMGLRSAFLGSMFTPASWRPPFPDWINPDFAGRVQLRDRFDAGWRAWHEGEDLHHQLRRPWLSLGFEYCEALKIPVAGRYPFHDLRLVSFMLGLPNEAVAEKKLLRNAMRARLPEQILARPKTALAGDHFRTRFCAETCVAFRTSAGNELRSAYIESDRYLHAVQRYLAGDGMESTWSSWSILAPIALDYWLRASRPENGGLE